MIVKHYLQESTERRSRSAGRLHVLDARGAPESTVMDETHKIAITRLGDRIRVGGMAEIAGDFFTRRWIDAPVRPGKAPGAFAHPTVPSAHPYVLLNFQGKTRDVMTLAHELGHSIVALRNGVRVRRITLWMLGGVGATPDDHTRQAAAHALGRPLASRVGRAILNKRAA